MKDTCVFYEIAEKYNMVIYINSNQSRQRERSYLISIKKKRKKQGLDLLANVVNIVLGKL